METIARLLALRSQGRSEKQEPFVKRPQGERNVSDDIHASLGRRDFIVGISPCLIIAGRETGSASSVSPENPEEGALRTAQQGGRSTVIKNTFAKGPEGWCSYEYHASVIAKSEIFVLATQAREGGVGNSAFIYTDHTRWSADTPEKPISILAYIYYLRWTDRDPMDLRGAEVSVYLRGDNLQLSGAKCYFWVNSPGVRWHLTSRPLNVTEGHWAKEPNRFTLVNDEGQWHNSWAGVPPRIQSLDSMLSHAHSYGFSFVGYSSEVTGRFSMDEFEITTKA